MCIQGRRALQHCDTMPMLWTAGKQIVLCVALVLNASAMHGSVASQELIETYSVDYQQLSRLPDTGILKVKIGSRHRLVVSGCGMRMLPCVITSTCESIMCSSDHIACICVQTPRFQNDRLDSKVSTIFLSACYRSTGIRFLV